MNPLPTTGYCRTCNAPLHKVKAYCDACLNAMYRCPGCGGSKNIYAKRCRQCVVLAQIKARI